MLDSQARWDALFLPLDIAGVREQGTFRVVGASDGLDLTSRVFALGVRLQIRWESKREETKKVRHMPNLENLVEPRGIEPLTSWLPAMRSPS